MRGVTRRIIARYNTATAAVLKLSSTHQGIADASTSSCSSPTRPTSIPFRSTLANTPWISSSAFYSTHASPKPALLPCGRSITPSDDNPDDEEDDDEDFSHDEDGDEFERVEGGNGERVSHDAETVMRILRDNRGDLPKMRTGLDRCEIAVSGGLASEVLSRVCNDWETAFTFFLWAAKRPGYCHSIREYHSMISILAKMRKFDTAWSLIDEMGGGKDGRPRIITPHTLLIMIRRYCAVHDVSRAINTFYAYKKYGFDPGLEEFEGLLSALCRYRNVREAEHLLFCNRSVFPLSVKSFNIVLNGWCNVVVSVKNGERIWREMAKRGVRHDAVSYGCIISCYSKSKNFNMVMKLFKRMKKLGIEPDRKVYNAVVHALAKARLVNEARIVMRTMEEKGIVPNVVTYNSLIKPLCKVRKINEAKEGFEDMLQSGIQPSVRTYNVFLRTLRTTEEVFELLEKMKIKRCRPNYDTYIMLIRKFCRWRQVDCAFKLWREMGDNGMSPDRSCYIVLIHGLFFNGKLEDAYKYFLEMKDRQFLPDPKTEEMLHAWVSGRQVAANRMMKNPAVDGPCVKASFRKLKNEEDFLRQPENRKVVREKGYAFWGQ